MCILLLLDMAASAAGDRPAIGPDGDAITFSELADLAARGGQAISDAGARTLVHVGVNGPILPIAIFAAAAADVPFVPLNYRLADEQLLALLATLDAPIVIADARHVDALRAGGHDVVETSAWLRAVREAESRPLPPCMDDDSPAVVLFTSGTTSAPKGVVLRHANLVSYVLGTVDLASADPDDAALVTVPPYHVAGVASVLTNVYAGRRMVYLPDFDPGEWLALVQRERVTNAMVVPTMLARIVDHLDGADPAVPTLRSLAYGGARLPRPVLEAALEAFRSTGFVNAYGLTETSSTIAVLDADDHRAAMESADPVVRERLSSAGRIIPGIELCVRDEDGTVLSGGEPGELWVRGGQVSAEYLGLGRSLDDDGWFATRDRGWVDDAGYLFIEGRSDDTIIRGGENIAPAEIEDVIIEHPAVSDVVVVGLPDVEWGERTLAVVVPSRGQAVDPAALQAWVRERSRSSRTPDEVQVWDELPRTETGKLVRRTIIAKILEDRVTPELDLIDGPGGGRRAEERTAS